MKRSRLERDALGTVKVPGDAYYGSETERALKNFQVSGMPLQKDFITTYVLLKRCAASANMRSEKLDRKRGTAIIRACNDILKKGFTEQFKVDIFQAGGGTSTNMNVNEVIANRAIEILGGRKGDYKLVHPNDHVNMSQSSNDTFPSVMKIACFVASASLLESLALLEKRLAVKSVEFGKIIKIGRTHLQDAVPIRLGQEFSGYAGSIKNVEHVLKYSRERMLQLPLGGTAVGTGINAGAVYRREVFRELRKTFHAKFRPAKNVYTEMQSRVAELEFSDSMVEAASAIGKIANDLRLLGSGPAAGIGELILPEVQPGSSIMPGKINPSIPEMMNMVCFQVTGNGHTIEEAVNSGQLELNVFEPVIIFNLLLSIRILDNGSRTFAEKCVKGLKANMPRIKENLEKDLSIATALTPYIGYSKAAKIARTAYRERKTIMQVCMEQKILDKKTLARLLNPKNSV